MRRYYCEHLDTTVLRSRTESPCLLVGNRGAPEILPSCTRCRKRSGAMGPMSCNGSAVGSERVPAKTDRAGGVHQSVLSLPGGLGRGPLVVLQQYSTANVYSTYHKKCFKLASSTR